MMKTKKILATVISCLLLIGVAIGVSAADTPEVSIAQTNLSYEGATRILYKLNTANLAAGQTVKIAFSFDADAEVPAGKLDESAYAYVGTAFDYDGGKAVYSPGFAPADMTKTVYAIPVVVDADGNVVVSGEKVGFSVYDYMMSRFDGSYTSEQFLLYMATLDFGGSVQAAVKASEGKDPVDGYADAYYVLSVMDGSGEVTTYSYREPTEISIEAPKGYDGKLFDSFVDNKGVKYEDADFNIYSFELDKIGTTYVKYLYGDTEIANLKATVGAPASIANPDTSVVVKGGAEYYLEADVTLADGTVASLDFMADETAKIGTINLTEADGVVTVTDGITSFTMANGSTMRIEYVVISATANTGTLFYYVNNEYVAKTDVPSVEGTSNAGFAAVAANATAGEIALDYAIVGAKDGFITFTTTSVSSVVYDYDPAHGKFFKYNKTSDAAVGGNIKFEINEAVNGTATTALEAKVRLTGNFIASHWRNFMDFQFQTDIIGGRRYNIISGGTARIAFTPSAFYWGGAAAGDNVGTPYTITNAIASNEWFDLRIEHVGNKSYSIYINGEAVYTAANGTAAMDLLTIIPAENGQGSIQMADIRYTSK